MFHYQWTRNDGEDTTDIEGATAESYTLASEDSGKAVSVKVSFVDRHGFAESLTSDLVQVAASGASTPATGAPTIGGTLQVGETLTADTSSIADEDGLDGVSLSFQWIRNDGTTDADIQDATASTYTLTSDDEGKTIRVRVSFTDDAGNEESLTSAATAVVVATVPGAPGSVEVERGGTGKLVVSWEEPDSNGGSAVTGYTVQWKEAVDSWDTTADVSEATTTATSYTISRLSLGTEYAVRVIATNSVGDGPESAEVKETAEAETSQQQSGTPNTPATGAPAISGMAQAGQTLTADTSGIADDDGLDNVTFSYQWIRSDGTTDTDITRGTGSTYTLTNADEGKSIKLRVTFTDDGGNEETLTSQATETVSAAPENSPATGSPTISGTAQVGETLTADTSGIADADGLDNVSYSHQWIRNDGTTDSAIQDATASTYTLVAADEGKTIKVRVSFADDAENEETLTSVETAAVIAASPPARPTSLTATTVSHNSVVLSWDNPGDGTITGYVILRRDIVNQASGPFTTVESSTGSNATTYTDSGVSPETRYAYRIKAINSAGTSGQSGYVNVETPAAAPENSPATGAPTISGTAQVGETLSTSTSGIADQDGLSNASFTYQWIRHNLATHTDADINGATSATYTIQAGDLGKAIKVNVTFTDDTSNDESLTSAATAAVEAKPNNPASGGPTISGTAQVGETLTAGTSGISDSDGLDSATFSYQWLADDTDIAGAASATYTLTRTTRERPSR